MRMSGILGMNILTLAVSSDEGGLQHMWHHALDDESGAIAQSRWTQVPEKHDWNTNLQQDGAMACQVDAVCSGIPLANGQLGLVRQQCRVICRFYQELGASQEVLY